MLFAVQSLQTLAIPEITKQYWKLNGAKIAKQNFNNNLKTRSNSAL